MVKGTETQRVVIDEVSAIYVDAFGIPLGTRALIDARNKNEETILQGFLDWIDEREISETENARATPERGAEKTDRETDPAPDPATISFLYGGKG